MKSAEALLAKLQSSLRGALHPDAIAARFYHPDGPDHGEIGLSKAQDDALADLEYVLARDPRFEHLRDKVRAVALAYVFECVANRSRDHVSAFVSVHGKEPTRRTCYLPVEYLTVAAEVTFLGHRFIPVSDDRVPPALGRFSLQPPVGCVVEVETEGTDLGRMAARARENVRHSLRLLRIALHENLNLHDRQLRFTVADGYSFGGHIAGWQSAPAAAYDLGLSIGLVGLAEIQPVARLPLEPKSDLDKQVDLATRWIERAMFAGEPLISLLFLFFALEALLGRKSARLKAHELAVRQMVLSHITNGGFVHPSETYFLYDQVRSAAVHGETPPSIDQNLVDQFAWLVRRTLSQYLSLAEREGLQRRGRLLARLDDAPDFALCLEWLRTNGGPEWTSYLAQQKTPPRVAEMAALNKRGSTGRRMGVT